MLLHRLLIATAGFIICSVTAQDIVTALAQQDGISQFAEILEQNEDLVELLNEGVHTVLVPTDTALAAARLSMPTVFDTDDSIRALLEYHVLVDTHPSQSFSTSSQLVPTLLQNASYTNVTGGQRVELLRKDGQPTLLTAIKAESKIIQPDIFYKGGLLHIIDSVLQIPLSFPDTISKANMPYLVALLDKGHWLKPDSVAYQLALETPDLTIVAPNDPEYGAGFDGWNNLTQQELDRIFLYHVMPELVYTTNMLNDTAYSTLANLSIIARQYLAESNKSVSFFDQARITSSSYITANGVIHVVDRPLNPDQPGAEPSRNDIIEALDISPAPAKKGLSTAAIVGIVIGALAASILMLVLLLLLRRRLGQIRQMRQTRQMERDSFRSTSVSSSPYELDSKIRHISRYEMEGVKQNMAKIEEKRLPKTPSELDTQSNRSVPEGIVTYSRCDPLRRIPRPQQARWQPATTLATSSRSAESAGEIHNASTAQARLQELSESGFHDYPRSDGKSTANINEFRARWLNQIPAGQTVRTAQPTIVVGRIASARTAGSKLVFIDLAEHSSNQRLQIVVNNGQLENHDSSLNLVKPFSKLVRRGDVISVKGWPHSTKTEELSILATSIPQLLTPCLHHLPTTAFGSDSELSHERHVEMLTDSSIIETIKARSVVTSTIQSFFQEHDFVNVQTPILAGSAGGATARSFETTATEFSDRKLALRIAPELWLKRLIVGGMQRVYELGPSFRNEGLDKTHNPEFTTSEFYATGWTLGKLQEFTQSLVERVASKVTELDPAFGESIKLKQGTSWPQIDFLPSLNAAMKDELPDLSSPGARERVIEMFARRNIDVPSAPTLPRLVDKLCSIYLEPRCGPATWIVNIPECLSPLAKSFQHPELPSQRVAARAELFIHHKEVVNCYEEENSPVEQRRKFVAQQEYAQLSVDQARTQKAVDDEAMRVDEDYIRALEWGLPPTGGWGCGIDRLLMLMLGKDKISDVLTFGNLRMVTRRSEKWEASES